MKSDKVLIAQTGFYTLLTISFLLLFIISFAG